MEGEDKKTRTTTRTTRKPLRFKEEEEEKQIPPKKQKKKKGNKKSQASKDETNDSLPAAFETEVKARASPSQLLPRLHFVKFSKVDGGKTSKCWECGVCGKEFANQGGLVRHIPTHTGERSYSCSRCEKSFGHRSTLSQHLATHAPSVRPFACPDCDKTFARSSVLHAHRKTHSDERDFACGVCGKAFRAKANLAAHEITHGEARPFECEVCGKGFNQKSNLTVHLKLRHLAAAAAQVKSKARDVKSDKSEDGGGNRRRQKQPKQEAILSAEPVVLPKVEFVTETEVMVSDNDDSDDGRHSVLVKIVADESENTENNAAAPRVILVRRQE